MPVPAVTTSAGALLSPSASFADKLPQPAPSICSRTKTKMSASTPYNTSSPSSPNSGQRSVTSSLYCRFVLSINLEADEWVQ